MDFSVLSYLTFDFNLFRFVCYVKEINYDVKLCKKYYKIAFWKRELWLAKKCVSITVCKTWKCSRHYTPLYIRHHAWTVRRMYAVKAITYYFQKNFEIKQNVCLCAVFSSHWFELFMFVLGEMSKIFWIPYCLLCMG